MRTHIGTFTVSMPYEFKTMEQVAAWYRMIRVEPQTVDIFANVSEGGRIEDFNGIGWQLDGTVVDAHFPSLFGGVAYSSGDRPEQHGQPYVHHVSPYAHAIAREVLEGRATGFSWDLGVYFLWTPYGDPEEAPSSNVGYSSGIYYEPSLELIDLSAGVAAHRDRGSVSGSASAEFVRGFACAAAKDARDLLSESALASSAAHRWAREAQRRTPKEAIA